MGVLGGWVPTAGGSGTGTGTKSWSAAGSGMNGWSRKCGSVFEHCAAERDACCEGYACKDVGGERKGVEEVLWGLVMGVVGGMGCVVESVV